MGLRIAVVGPCASGKTVLVQALRARGYDARQCAQEHSYVPTMWQRISRPDVLIYLDAELPTIMQRRSTWDERLLEEQRQRLSHARAHCDLYLRTDTLSREEVVQAAMNFLRACPKGPLLSPPRCVRHPLPLPKLGEEGGWGDGEGQ